MTMLLIQVYNCTKYWKSFEEFNKRLKQHSDWIYFFGCDLDLVQNFVDLR